LPDFETFVAVVHAYAGANGPEWNLELLRSAFFPLVKPDNGGQFVSRAI
jgi:hypothetical protein